MIVSNPPPPPFESHARIVIRSVRGAFSQLLASVGADPADPQAMSRQVGLNKNLAWKVSKIVQSDDPTTALQQMPGSAGIDIFLRSMERAGADAEALRIARMAIEEYERLIQVHSGDRATLDMMGSELSVAGRQQRDEYYRKLLFQGASYVWGAQARVVLKVGVVGPGSGPGLLDFASLNGLIDFRRFRSDVAWVMATRTSNNDDGSEMLTTIPEPIDPRFAGRDLAPLMGDFCSQPLPELRRCEGPGGMTFELAEGRIGNTGARTCVFGSIQREIPYYRTLENRWGEHSALSDTPAELMIIDLFIYEQFSFAQPPEMHLFSEMGASRRAPGRGRTQLPIYEPLQDLGVGPLLLATPEVARYQEMVQRMFDRTGWDPTEFHGYRVKIPYPACPTALVLRYELPERPE